MTLTLGLVLKVVAGVVLLFATLGAFGLISANVVALGFLAACLYVFGSVML
jgi:hypothetical protein